MKKALQNPDLREKWRKSATGRKLTPETVAKIIATRHKNYPPTMKVVTVKLDNLFSMHKRLMNTNPEGYIQCFTCDHYFSYTEIDCGHYISRSHKNTRWSEKNTEPQCRSCNRFHEGVKDVFALNLQKKYGMGILQELDDEKRKVKKYTIPEIEDMMETYKLKVKELKERNKLN